MELNGLPTNLSGSPAIRLASPAGALRISRDPKDGTYARALNLGWQRNLLAKSERERVSDPLLYSLTEGVAT